MNIAIYSRKSSFTTVGESIANQVELCKEHILHHFGSGCVFTVYEDEGFSGGNIDRPMFQKFLHDSKKIDFSVLICYRLDRISRNVSDFSAILEYLQSMGINFISLRESFDTSTPIGRAMIYIASVFAQLERETIAERIRDNKYSLARDGRWQGGTPPLGYTAEKVLTPDKKSYFVLRKNPDEVPFIKQVYELYQKLGTLTQLEIHMLRNGILTPTGNEISKAVLRQTLSNPTYAVNDPCVYDYLTAQGFDVASERAEFNSKSGMMGYAKTQQYGKDMKRRRQPRDKWIFAVSRHPGIISGEDWVNTQKKLSGNSLPPRSDTSHVALLSTLIRCGKCNAPMIVMGQRTNKNGEKNFFYACSRKRRSNGALCDMKNIKGPAYDKALVTTLKEYCLNGKCLSSEIEKEAWKAQKTHLDYQNEINLLQKKIASNEKAIKRLLVTAASSDNEDELTEYIQGTILDLSKENSAFKLKISQILEQQTKEDTKTINAQIIQHSIDMFMNTFDKSVTKEQQRLIKSSVQSIIWDGESSHVNFLWENSIENNEF